MPKCDSIIMSLDSSAAHLSDSIAMIDSISVSDSILADTFKTIVKIPRGHVGFILPSHPQNESWVFVSLTVLFLLFVFSSTRSGGLISETIKTFFQVKERSSIFSKTTISDFRVRFFMVMFTIGVASLLSYLILYDPATSFELSKYGLFFAATIIFVIAKLVFLNLAGFVFIDVKNLKMLKESYFDIIALLGISLFPLLIFYIYSSPAFNNATEIISYVVVAIGYVLLTIKLFQIFLHKLVATFYILLYLCTLEFLPLMALFWVYNYIILAV